MSDAARRLIAFRFGYRELLAHPRNTPEWERAVVDLEWRLLSQAHYIISWGC